MLERIPPLDSQPALQILLELIWLVLSVLTERPASVVVPPVCVILLEAVRALPKSSVPTYRFVI